ncbi:MAG TPA: TadE/TadG family type IV pilus assembly protein [Anaerolineales bacterium]
MMDTQRRRERGQELVEYALLLPIFLLLLMVLLDMGRAIYYYSTVQNAARAGARYGIVHTNDTAGVAAAARQIAVGLDPANFTVTVVWDITPAGSIPDTVNVRVAYHFDIITPIIGTLIGSNQIFLVGRATMQLEQ